MEESEREYERNVKNIMIVSINERKERERDREIERMVKKKRYVLVSF